MGKLKDFFEAVVGFAAGSTLVGLVLGTVPLTKVVSTFIGAVQQNFLYFGLSYITSKGSEDTAQRNLGIKTAVTNPVAPRNVVYGKTRVGGTIVQRTVSSKSGSTSQNVLHHVIAVAGHEINNITKVFIDGGKGTVELDLSSDFTSATENSTTVFRCTNSDFVNADNTDAYTGGSLIKLAFEKGDQTAANAYAVAQIPSSNWTTDHKMLGIAFVYVNCIYDSEKFTAIPTFSFEVEGKKVFDPVSSSTVYSTNPALIIRDYLMDSTYGFGAVADEINDAASGAGFVQARSDCNDSVSITGGSESRFTLNGEFVATEEPQRVLETMLSACAGQLLYNNGKFSLFVGKGRTASGTITDDKILAPIQIQTKASGKDLVNGVKATYVRPDDKYIAGEITPYKDSTFLTEDTPTGKASADYENFLDLAFPYTHSSFTAQRLARIALNYERQDQTLSVLVPLDFLSHQVGDIVNLDNDRLGYSGKDFEIIGMSFEFLNDQYLALRLSLKEYSSTIFDFFTYVADPTLPSEPPSGDNTVGSPTGLSLAEFVKDSQVRLHFIRATWTNSVDDKIVTTEVAYKKSTDSNFDAADVSYPSNSFSFYVEPATTYNVKVRHITNTGVSSSYTGTVDLTTSGGQVTLTTGTISGITIESGKLYQGTGTFNNSNTGFYIDSSGQFSLKDKLSFNGTTLNISGNLTVENTITADKIVVGGITLDNLISATDQASSNYLTTFSGAVKIASGGASAGYPAELQIQATEHTNAIGTLQQSQTQLTIRSRNNTSNGAIAFQGFNGTTPTNYGNFDASGNLNLNQNLVVSGDLTVSGTTTTVDTTNTNVKDNNLTLNYSTGDSSSTANGAGLTIQDAVSASTDATILWDSTNDEFDFSHKITTPSIQTSGASTIDELTVTNDALFQGSIDVGGGTIDCGAITTSGLLTVGSGAGAIKINESFITARSSDNANDINLIANINVLDADDIVIGSTSGQRFNDNIVLRTGGANRVTIDSSGRVGINTTDPNGQGYSFAEDLVVLGGNSADDGVGITLRGNGKRYGVLAFGDNADPNSGEIFYDHTANSMSFRTNDQIAATIDSSQRVGIGYTTITSYKFAVNGSAYINNGIYLPDGSASSPILSFDSDSNVGLFRPAADTLGFTTGGSEIMRLTSTGLGIGTTSPTGKLNIVSGSSGSYLVNLDYNDGTDGGGFFQSGSVGLSLLLKNASATQTVQIATAGDSFFNGGDVGIGTSSPSSALHVKGGSTSTPSDFSAFISNATLRSVVNHSNEYGLYMGYANSSTDACAIQAGRSNGTTDPLLLNPYGDNVGIGTTSPSSTLDVNGDVTITNKLIHSGDTDTFMKFDTNQIGFVTGNSTRFQIQTSLVRFNQEGVNQDFQVFGQNDDNLFFADASTDRVGIGTNSPNFKLHLKDGTSTAVYQQFSNDTTGNTTGDGTVLGIDADGDFLINNLESKTIKLFTADTERLRVDSSGNLGVGTSNPAVKLDVVGDITASGSGDKIISAISSDDDGTLFLSGAGSGKDTHIVFGNDRDLFISKSSSTTATSEGTPVLTLGSNNNATFAGNVGIGTTSPAVKLDIVGDTRIKASSTTATALTIKRSSSSGRAQMAFTDESDNQIFRIGMTGAGSENFSFFDGSTNILDLNRSSNTATFSNDVLISNGSLIVNQEGQGIHLLSANGTEYKLTVSNAGALVITEQ